MKIQTQLELPDVSEWVLRKYDAIYMVVVHADVNKHVRIEEVQMRQTAQTRQTFSFTRPAVCPRTTLFCLSRQVFTSTACTLHNRPNSQLSLQ